MAMFREHISIGAAVSAVIVTLVYFYAFITDPLMLIILFSATTIASFFPDLDSDSGLPFHLIFGTFTLACTALVLYYMLQSYAHDWRFLVGVPLTAMVGVWVIVGTIFKHFTEHRGMMHSTPAAVIAGLLTFLAARHFDLTELESLVFAVAIAAGYASHLILDELHSGFNLDGIPFIPKRSLGTAIKFFSDSHVMNIATYTMLAGLVYVAMG